MLDEVSKARAALRILNCGVDLSHLQLRRSPSLRLGTEVTEGFRWLDDPYARLLSSWARASIQAKSTSRSSTRARWPPLEATPEKAHFDGDPQNFRLGIEVLRLGLAYEYDPYFALSIARVDPLPHQLEAVYDYFLRLPRIRFLLADDQIGRAHV